MVRVDFCNAVVLLCLINIEVKKCESRIDEEVEVEVVLMNLSRRCFGCAISTRGGAIRRRHLLPFYS